MLRNARKTADRGTLFISSCYPVSDCRFAGFLRRLGSYRARFAYPAMSPAHSAAGGKVSKLYTAPVTAQGTLSFVQVSINGANHDASSSIVGRRLTNVSMPCARVKIQLMQCGQK